MTTSYTRGQLDALEHAMLDKAPALPEAEDLNRAYCVAAVLMAGSDAGLVLNIGITHKNKPVFIFMNCVVTRELFLAIHGAADEVWPRDKVNFIGGGTLAPPSPDDMNAAADVISLTTTATPVGMLVNLRGADETFAIYLPRAIALEIFEGIRIAGERASWWDGDFELLPADREQKQVSERDVWTAANQIIRLSDEPELEAAQRADAALAAGDSFNFRLWVRVLAAVQELRRKKPAGEAAN